MNTPSNPDGVVVLTPFITANYENPNYYVKVQVRTNTELHAAHDIVLKAFSPQVDRGVSTAEGEAAELARLKKELAESKGGDREDEEERAGIRERIAELTAPRLQRYSFKRLTGSSTLLPVLSDTGEWVKFADAYPRHAPVAYHEPPLRDTQAGLSVTDEMVKLAAIEMAAGIEGPHHGPDAWIEYQGVALVALTAALKAQP